MRRARSNDGRDDYARAGNLDCERLAPRTRPGSCSPHSTPPHPPHSHQPAVGQRTRRANDAGVTGGIAPGASFNEAIRRPDVARLAGADDSAPALHRLPWAGPTRATEPAWIMALARQQRYGLSPPCSSRRAMRRHHRHRAWRFAGGCPIGCSCLAICPAIVDLLPAWFGVPAANEDYVDTADTDRSVIASVDHDGITTVKHHSPCAAEVPWWPSSQPIIESASAPRCSANSSQPGHSGRRRSRLRGLGPRSVSRRARRSR
jgi:hypothetical protein